jgi:hypothetical protein
MRSSEHIVCPPRETIGDIGPAPRNHGLGRRAQLGAQRDPMEQDVGQLVKPFFVENPIAHPAPQCVDDLSDLADEPEACVS